MFRRLGMVAAAGCGSDTEIVGEGWSPLSNDPGALERVCAAAEEGFAALVFEDLGYEPPTSVQAFDGDGCPRDDVPPLLVEPRVVQVTFTPDCRLFGTTQDDGFGEIGADGRFRPIRLDEHAFGVTIAPTGEVIYGHFGGQGEFISFDPLTDALSVRASLDNVDLGSFAALPSGALVGRRIEHGTAATVQVGDLAILDPWTGAIEELHPISPTLPGVRGGDYKRDWQLRTHGDGLFVVRRVSPEVPFVVHTVDEGWATAPVVCPQR